MHYHIWYHRKTYDIMYDIILTSFLRYYDIVKKIWYHIWYHITSMISWMNSYLIDNIMVIYPFLALFFCDIAYDFMYISYKLCYDISILWYYSWHHSIHAMIRPSDISMSWYHSHVISRISGYVRLYHGTCAAGWRGLGPPGASCSTSSSLTIANVAWTCWGLVFSWTATGQRPWSHSWTCLVCATSS